MNRAFLVVLDSVGCGGAPDAAEFGDKGANTLAHIAQACARGEVENGRSGPLCLPFMNRLGLGAAVHLASGVWAPALEGKPQGLWGAATEISRGKDTPSGHWELAGVPVPWEWHRFPVTQPAFPTAISARVAELAGTTEMLGNCHASGTEIIARLGADHLRTGWPICYTSSDSVFQIAAHEETFGLEKLLHLCNAIAPELHAIGVGRVIARPFTGTAKAGFERTTHRRDYAIAPPAPTLCDMLQAVGRRVHGIGKIGDIFSMRGIDTIAKGDDASLMAALSTAVAEAEPGSLTFANFVEFDSLYGHRRDVAGYARALEWFDHEIAKVSQDLRKGDLMILTADHGNDPTWPGTEHTRERVPVLGCGPGITGAIGHVGFSDVGATLAQHLDVTYTGAGRPFTWTH